MRRGAGCPGRSGRARAADLRPEPRTSDASTDPASWTTHQAYTALAQGFGPGFNGPLELAARTGIAGRRHAFQHLLATAAHTPGVASVTPALTSPNGKVRTGHRLPRHRPAGRADRRPGQPSPRRPDPAGRHGTGLAVHVGGVTADQHRLRPRADGQAPGVHRRGRDPGVLLLLVVFRSLLIPLVASVMNLLSVGAALGRAERGLQLGLGHLGARPVRDRPDRLVRARDHVLRAVRAVHGLPGVPGQPDPGGMASAAPLAQRQLTALSGRASPAQPPGHHCRPGQQRADHRGRGQHHDPGLRVVPARRPPDPARSSASRSRSPSWSTPWSSAVCWYLR